MLLLVACATEAPSQKADERDPAFAVFTPAPKNTSDLDYAIVDEFLTAYVVETGRSLRIRAPSVDTPTGTRVRYGHTSPLRLEGNKILFSEFLPTTKHNVADWVESLVEIGNTRDLTALPRNEQLAYWFNLHNLLVIREIARTYPVRYPSRIEPLGDGASLHDAKLVTIKGVPLSLRDIRTRIVYTNWSDPRVIYGFFHGDLGSPNIRREAWKGATMSADLTDNAKEFVNSLRGVQNTFGPTLVSRHYAEARPYLFPDWPEDLRDHLLAYAEEEVAAIVRTTEEFGFAEYEDRVADLMGGMNGPVVEPLTDNLDGLGFGPPGQQFQKQSMYREYREKQIQLIRKLRRRGATVTIVDERTTDPGEEVQ
ncbi:DUF547 domain-containing protein [Parvularcula lutaonensis]|uniref:DUF547 domain-containing protein n=1 Tax=Parvularcula lutaonensis TaxID=491923 RepID=A0ABV7MD41_9PROT|nr:DUF547 domain-containing protein [Parvularcula lutaonensis]